MVEGSGIAIEMNELGCYCAVTHPDLCKNKRVPVTAVCPFSDSALNEDEISKSLFVRDCQYNQKIGFYMDLYAGYVVEKDFRDLGSSGGMVNWILCTLINNNLVDQVLHVGSRQPTKKDPRLFHFKISKTMEEVHLSSKSRYYPVEMSEVLKYVIDQPGRYAITGVPCFIKAIRLVQMQIPVLKERIHYSLSLVCGHLKSKQYAEMLAWQCGIKPDNLLSIDFRKKMPGLNANQYGVEVSGLINGKIAKKYSLISKLYGSDWGLCFFKYKACDYCDDLFGETADVTLGDAWIKPYIKDGLGNNIVIVRNSQLNEIIKKGMRYGQLSLDKINSKDVIRSQKNGLFHRREALAYRLTLDDKKNEWYPKKRISKQDNHFNNRLKHKYSFQLDLSDKSHHAFQYAKERDQLSYFIDTMKPLESRFRIVEESVWKIIIKKIVAWIRNIRLKYTKN